MKTLVKAALVGMTLGAALGTALPVLADPPAHAPAHGWRKKNDPRYVGYTGRNWERDYGILEGRCNRDAVGAVVGGVIGGAIGSQIGSGDGRTIAIIAGTILGAVVGHEIGRDMDRSDRGCFGHALELGRDGTPIRWDNPALRVNYVLTPTGGYTKNGTPCRNFRIAETRNGKRHDGSGRACRTADGEWKLVR